MTDTDLDEAVIERMETVLGELENLHKQGKLFQNGFLAYGSAESHVTTLRGTLGGKTSLVAVSDEESYDNFVNAVKYEIKKQIDFSAF